MLPGTYQALIVALLAVVPGFLGTAAWSRAKTWPGFTADLTMVLRAIAASFAIQVLATPLTIVWLYPVRTHLDAHPWRVAGWLTVVVLVVPLGGGRLLAAVDDVLFPTRPPARFPPRWHRLVALAWRPQAPPSVWDWFFTQQPPDGRFVIVEYKDGSRRGGVFGKGGYVLTSPEPHGLYLPEEWILDADTGDPLAPIPNSAGILIASDAEIRSVRVVTPQHSSHEKEDA